MFFFFNDTATTEIYTLSLHDALPIFDALRAIREKHGVKGEDVAGVYIETTEMVHRHCGWPYVPAETITAQMRSEEHTSELQSRQYLVCRLLLEKKKKKMKVHMLNINQ